MYLVVPDKEIDSNERQSTVQRPRKVENLVADIQIFMFTFQKKLIIQNTYI